MFFCLIKLIYSLILTIYAEYRQQQQQQQQQRRKQELVLVYIFMQCQRVSID